MNRPKIKRHAKGSIPRDGMTGGRWENTTRLAYKDVPVERMTECISDDGKAEKCLEWLTARIGDSFRVEAYFDVGYDYSVGLDSYCDMNESFDADDVVYDSIGLCPCLSIADKHDMTVLVGNLIEDEEGYEFYEID